MTLRQGHRAADTRATDVGRVIDVWREREARYRARRYQGAGSVDGFRYVDGDGARIILTAPHAVKHVRDGITKAEDLGTGGLCEALADELGLHGLAADGPQTGDANWDAEPGPFKRALFRLLQPESLVLDLHGMKDAYGVDVCIGSGAHADERGGAIAAKLTASLEANGLRVAVNVPFDAKRPTTITSSVQTRGASALQLELARRLRTPAEDGPAALLVRALLHTLESL